MDKFIIFLVCIALGWSAFSTIFFTSPFEPLIGLLAANCLFGLLAILKTDQVLERMEKGEKGAKR